MTSASRSIHVLGIGCIGKLVAHSLAASKSAPKIILIFHHPKYDRQWEFAGRRINVVTDGISDLRSNFDVERIFDSNTAPDGPITNLIVATKTYGTVEALRPLRHRLNHDSTILFLQNGMGTVEEINKSLFADLAARPHQLAGVVNHGVYSNGVFSIVHAGQANMSVGMASLSDHSDASTGEAKSKQSEYLLQSLHEAPALSASIVSPSQLRYAQLEKLAVNSVINPLTTIFDCLNGQLFNRPTIHQLIQRLIVEISPILLRLLFSDVDTSSTNNSTAPLLFSPQALESTIADVAAKTAMNSSSMRADMHLGKKTEIDYINGYVVARASEMGFECLLNQKLVEMVHGGEVISVDRINDYFPPSSPLL